MIAALGGLILLPYKPIIQFKGILHKYSAAVVFGRMSVATSMISNQSRCSEFLGRKSTRIFTLLLVSVTAGCASSRWYDTPPSTPVPISPQATETLGPAPSVTFSWKAAERAETYDFHVFNVATSDIDKHMSRALRPSEICRGGTCSITMSLSLPSSERHAWRVRGVNIAGASAWTRNLFTWVAE